MSTRDPGVSDVIVIGAGPAGLATSRELRHHGVDHVVLERGPCLGHTWANLYDGLVLHTGKHLSSLPGLRFPPSTPLFPTRRNFVEYLNDYATRFNLPVRTNAEVVRVTHSDGVWNVALAGDSRLASHVLVVATGIVSNPSVPDFPHQNRFRGRILHSVEYRRPDAHKGRRVLIVGAGNSAAEIAAELARAGADVTVSVRSGARVVPLRLLGIPIQYVAATLNGLPLRAQRRIASAIAKLSEVFRGPAVLPPPVDTDCPDVPLIGFHLVDAVRAGAVRLKPAIRELTEDGARFVDGTEAEFDEIMLATGYKAAVGMLGGLVHVDDCGFAARHSRVVSADQPNLYFVGHNYDVRGGLRNIAIDARATARLIANQLASSFKSMPKRSAIR
ncbi:MAG: NAD(P)/FAD-dependent oxidoreductase [Vicinamibacterales bacterium]